MEPNPPNTSLAASDAPRFAISMVQVFVIQQVVIGLVCLLLPVVNHVRDKQELPAVLPWLDSLCSPPPELWMLWLPLLPNVLVLLLILKCRSLLPSRVQRFFPWRHQPVTATIPASGEPYG